MLENVMIKNLIAIFFLMGGNVATGIAKSKSLEEFNKQTLINSLYKYGGVLVACLCIYGASVFVPNIEIAEGYTLIGALEMIQDSLILLYGFKLVQNVIEIMGIKQELKEASANSTQYMEDEVA